MFDGLFEQISAFADGLPHPGLFAALGLFSIVALSVIVLIWLVRLALRGSHYVHVEASMRAMARDDTPGSKIMVASVGGRQGMSARAAILSALEHYLPEFNFGSPFYLGSCPVQIEATDFALSKTDHTHLVTTFEKSGANLIIWGETRGGEKGTILCLSTPDMLDGDNPNGFFSVVLNGSPSDWGETAKLAIAYVAGRRLRPALGRPADFRADRLLPIATAMARLLEAEPVLTDQAQTQLEDDYAAGALHIGEQLKNSEWLNKAADYRASALAKMNRAEDPVRWAQAKIDLGRAMTLQCEQKFEPARLQEAMNHIREAIDSTKSDSRMKLAEAGVAALQQAETMLANRRRFSIRWNV